MAGRGRGRGLPAKGSTTIILPEGVSLSYQEVELYPRRDIVAFRNEGSLFGKRSLLSKQRASMWFREPEIEKEGRSFYSSF